MVAKAGKSAIRLSVLQSVPHTENVGSGRLSLHVALIRVLETCRLRLSLMTAFSSSKLRLAYQRAPLITPSNTHSLSRMGCRYPWLKAHSWGLTACRNLTVLLTGTLRGQVRTLTVTRKRQLTTLYAIGFSVKIVYDNSPTTEPLTLWTRDLDGLKSLLEEYRRHKANPVLPAGGQDYSWLSAYTARPSRPTLRTLTVRSPVHDRP